MATAISANKAELIAIANSVASEKMIDKAIVIEAMEDAIQRAARARYGAENDIRAKLDPNTGDLRLWRVVEVVEAVDDYFKQVDLKGAQKLQKDAATMTPDQRTKAEKELRDGARDLERKKQELQDDSNAKRNDEVGKLQRSLMTEVRDYAKAQNYDIVIAEGVIYATPAVDITPAVLAALQARAPKAPAGGSPAPAKPAAKP